MILVDVPVTLWLRRCLFSEKSGVFREILAILHGLVMGAFYVLLLKNDKTFFVVIDYGDNFYRDLIVQNVGVLIMVFFHAWSVSVRHK